MYDLVNESMELICHIPDDHFKLIQTTGQNFLSRDGVRKAAILVGENSGNVVPISRSGTAHVNVHFFPSQGNHIEWTVGEPSGNHLVHALLDDHVIGTVVGSVCLNFDRGPLSLPLFSWLIWLEDYLPGVVCASANRRVSIQFVDLPKSPVSRCS